MLHQLEVRQRHNVRKLWYISLKHTMICCTESCVVCYILPFRCLYRDKKPSSILLLHTYKFTLFRKLWVKCTWYVLDPVMKWSMPPKRVLTLFDTSYTAKCVWNYKYTVLYNFMKVVIFGVVRTWWIELLRQIQWLFSFCSISSGFLDYMYNLGKADLYKYIPSLVHSFPKQIWVLPSYRVHWSTNSQLVRGSIYSISLSFYP